jgi:hypothetical protein
MSGFLDRISGLLDKGLLLAAALPLLIAGIIVATAAANAVGWRSALLWLGSLSATNVALMTAFLTLVLLLLSFVLRSLRRPILSVWSGSGCPSWMRDRQHRRREELETQIRAPASWENIAVTVETIVYERRPALVPAAEHRRLLRAIVDLSADRHTADQAGLRQRFNQLCTEIAERYRQYDGESLIPLRARMVAFGNEQQVRETAGNNSLRARLLLEYGQAGVVEGTRLGNILAALDGYPFKRYGMEGSVFWPHLEQVIKDDLLDDIQNQRILLDFELALATLLLVLAILALMVQPRIPLGALPSVLTAVVALIALARLLYVSALPTAGAMSTSLRVGCDLYRQDLLWAFGVYAPRNLEAERAAWERLSRLVIYGELHGGVQFRPRPPQAPPGHDP